MRNRYRRVLDAITESPWMILPSTLETIVGIVEARARGERADGELLTALQAAHEDEPVVPIVRDAGVAVLALHGVIAQRMNLFLQISGGTSTEMFGQAFDATLADPQVSAVVLDIASTGGSVYGVEELARRIYRARAGTKPIVAVADSEAFSAAYYLGSQAHEFVVTPSGAVGSIGVVVSHTDVSRAEDARGLKTTVIAIPPGKVVGHPYEPLSEAARAALETRMAPWYELFVAAVARGRGVSATAVREGYGQGGVLAAAPARAAGMVDRIESREEAVARLKSAAGRRAVLASAAAEHARLRAEVEAL